MAGKSLLIILITFLLIIGVSIGSLVMAPETYVYAELDNEPGYTDGDEMLEIIKGFQIDSYTRYPNYVIPLVVVFILGAAGVVVVFWKMEKERLASLEKGMENN